MGDVATMPRDALRPADEADLAEAVRGADGPLAIRGGGTRSTPGEGRVLSTAALTGVTLYEPGALTLVVRAGTPLREVEDVLAAERQRLAFEPWDARGLLGTEGESTIGGVVAANASGPRRIQAGAARDFALGVRFVDGAGRVIRNGGRVMKNVTGYDLVKLQCGACGTLGILTEVSLKVLPVPETQATLAIEKPEPGGAVATMSAALGSPFEVTGAAWDGARVLLRLEGFGDSVTYRAGALRGHLGADAEVFEADDSAALWESIRDVTVLAGEGGDIWRVSVRPSAGPAVVASVEPRAVQMDWGGGLIWLSLPPDTDLRARMDGIAGDATLLRAAPETLARLGRVHPKLDAVEALARGLRARFDPRGILNPGLLGA